MPSENSTKLEKVKKQVVIIFVIIAIYYAVVRGVLGYEPIRLSLLWVGLFYIVGMTHGAVAMRKEKFYHASLRSDKKESKGTA